MAKDLDTSLKFLRDIKTIWKGNLNNILDQFWYASTKFLLGNNTKALWYGA